MERILPPLLLLLILLNYSTLSTGACPNGCSGHGTCGYDGTNVGVCTCSYQWNTSESPDCAKLNCPSGVGWWSPASGVDSAHDEVECSNMGICDRTTATCTCETGYEGAACERLSCPLDCSGHGKCLSMREMGSNKDDVRLFNTYAYTNWDADKIYGCSCDVGYTGYDCSLRECPKGHNPVGSTAVTEIQIIDCICQTTCSGHFFISFMSEIVRVEHDDTSALLKAKLEATSGIKVVSLTLNGGTTVCDNDGVSTAIEFSNQAGDLPSIVVEDSTPLTSTGTAPVVGVVTGGSAGTYGGTSRDATSVAVECSAKGVCDTSTGLCTCLSEVAGTGGTFLASDGAGGAGSYDDCGYVSVTPTACPYGDPGTGTVECTGRGTCDGTTYECNCPSGYTGIACELLECPSGTAWFDEPSAANTAHATAECSNRGICDLTTGECTCQSPFTGSACNYLACPGTSSDCNGHGSCFTLNQLAVLSESNGELLGYTYGDTPTSETWDYNSVRGCYCDQGYYHGPYAADYADFIGYDCTELSCPIGDNPQTLSQVNEVQTISCIATSGTFTLTFRQKTTNPLNYDATVAEVKTALDELFSVAQVSVSFSGGSTTAACASPTATSIAVTFQMPGDLPLMTVDSSLLGGATVSVAETTAGKPLSMDWHISQGTIKIRCEGTTEQIECSGQGVCDRTTGICSCFSGFKSSDGSGDGVTGGQRGDCGALDIFGGTVTS